LRLGNADRAGERAELQTERFRDLLAEVRLAAARRADQEDRLADADNLQHFFQRRMRALDALRRAVPARDQHLLDLAAQRVLLQCVQARLHRLQRTIELRLELADARADDIADALDQGGGGGRGESRRSESHSETFRCCGDGWVMSCVTSERSLARNQAANLFGPKFLEILEGSGVARGVDAQVF
jgi:hypothetical protein